MIVWVCFALSWALTKPAVNHRHRFYCTTTNCKGSNYGKFTWAETQNFPAWISTFQLWDICSWTVQSVLSCQRSFASETLIHLFCFVFFVWLKLTTSFLMWWGTMYFLNLHLRENAFNFSLFFFIFSVSSLNEWQLAAIQYVFQQLIFSQDTPKSNHDMVPVTYHAVHIPS